MYEKKKILWITHTAVFTALLIAFQFLTSLTGVTLITGSVVNMMLILSVMICGITSGLTVGIISPVAAKLIGIGPLWELIPFIILGNVTLVIIWHFAGNINLKKKYISYIIAAAAAAAGKFTVLYIGIVRIAVPLLLSLPEPQAEAVSALFSVHQLITASIGGCAALIVLPRLKQAIGTGKD